jgi:predicted nucleotide-binding protein
MIDATIGVLESPEYLEHLANPSQQPVGIPVPSQAVLSNKVFVVHGHAGEQREAVARFLQRLGLEPIILHEQANQGRTIIEKFEDHAAVGFAIVLLTPDDVGSSKDGDLHPRARQNVVLELGYFIGRLGRSRVSALKVGDLELPSDILGIVWTSFDAGEGWKLGLAKELAAAGYSFDWREVAHG